MSAAPASSSHTGATGTGHAAGARAAQAGARKPGAHGAGNGTDHFSMLLSLLSATSDVTGLPAFSGADGSGADPLATDTTGLTGTTNPADGSHLAAVMQWMGLPQNGGAKRAATPDADTEGGLSATGGRTARGHDGNGPLFGLAAERGTPAGSGQGEALPAGMQALDQAEAPDAATLAALAGQTDGVPADPAAATAANTVVTAPHPGTAKAAAHAPANFHSSPGAATASTQALQQQPVTVQIERLQSRGEPVLATTRSTVTLDERFSSSTPSGDALTAGAVSGMAAPAAAPAGAGAGGDLPGHHSGQGGQDTSAAASSSGNDSGSGGQNPDDGAQWAAEERAINEERLDGFTAPTLHEAKLRVGDNDDAIDIRLSLSGQELDLGFRTDSAEARAALADHAQGSLSELLQRSGIQLGDVSVGAQNGQAQQGNGGDARHTAGRTTTPTVGRAERAGTAETATPVTPLRPRSDGNRPLDLFI